MPSSGPHQDRAREATAAGGRNGDSAVPGPCAARCRPSPGIECRSDADLESLARSPSDSHVDAPAKICPSVQAARAGTHNCAGGCLPKLIVELQRVSLCLSFLPYSVRHVTGPIETGDSTMIRRVVACLATASFVLMPIAAQANAPVRPGSAMVPTAVPAGIRSGIEPGTDVSNLHGG